MDNQKDIPFLCKRLKELREKNDCTMDELCEKLKVLDHGIKPHKSVISRVESGKTGEKKVIEMAYKYCTVFGMSERQTQQFLRGEKIAIPDTSALLNNPQLIDALNEEYSIVVIPQIVVNELDNIKDTDSGPLGTKAWEIIRGISYGDRTVSMSYTGPENIKNDLKIIKIAETASQRFNGEVEIITNDTDYSAYLKGEETITAVHLREYMVTKQKIVNMTKVTDMINYFADSYDDVDALTIEEANAYDKDGFTLIISTIRAKKTIPLNQKIEKIKWLISCGADVNKRDANRRYFPPLSHAIQVNDLELFKFLLHECKANPNVGSRNPFDSGKVRQKNEGNMPLMVAAYDGRKDFVVELCNDERTSINQQDANGFTALMKACMNGHFANNREKRTWDIRSVIIAAGADQKIVDIDGRTAADFINEYHKNGPSKKIFKKNRRK